MEDAWGFLPYSLAFDSSLWIVHMQTFDYTYSKAEMMNSGWDLLYEESLSGENFRKLCGNHPVALEWSNLFEFGIEPKQGETGVEEVW